MNADIPCCCFRFKAALARHLPPNFGVVGPACDADKKLKGIFVHRTHGRIFEVYSLFSLAESEWKFSGHLNWRTMLRDIDEIWSELKIVFDKAWDPLTCDVSCKSSTPLTIRLSAIYPFANHPINFLMLLFCSWCILHAFQTAVIEHGCLIFICLGMPNVLILCW